MSDPEKESKVLQLAKQQLDAYNEGDIDAFCACYHTNVTVLDEGGNTTMQGIEAFRQRYAQLFETFTTNGTISHRVCLPPHVVEHEHWSRTNKETQEGSKGEVLVRYTEYEGLIYRVQFFHPPTD